MAFRRGTTSIIHARTVLMAGSAPRTTIFAARSNTMIGTTSKDGFCTAPAIKSQASGLRGYATISAGSDAVHGGLRSHAWPPMTSENREMKEWKTAADWSDNPGPVRGKRAASGCPGNSRGAVTSALLLPRPDINDAPDDGTSRSCGSVDQDRRLPAALSRWERDD